MPGVVAEVDGLGDGSELPPPLQAASPATTSAKASTDRRPPIVPIRTVNSTAAPLARPRRAANASRRTEHPIPPANGPDRTDPPTLASLRAHAQNSLAHHKLPEDLLLVDEIPLTAMQKVDRRRLSALIQEPDSATDSI